MLALFLDTFQKTIGHQLPQHRQSHVGHHGVGAEGGGVIPRLDRVSHLLFHQGGTDGETTPQRLGQGHHVRFDAELLVGPQGPGTPHADLDLVEYEQHVALVAQCAQALQELVAGYVDAALCLDRFDEDGTGLLRERLLHRRQVVEVGKVDARQQRFEPLVILGLPRRRDGADGAPVERIVEGEEAELASGDGVAPLAGELEGRLPGLGAGVAEEHAVGEGVFHQQLRQSCRGNRVVEVGHVHQLPRLFLDRLEDVVITVPEGVDRQAADEVEVAVAVEVEQVDPVAPFEDEIGPVVRLQDVLVLLLDHFFGSHVYRSLSVPKHAIVRSACRRPRR